MKNILLKPACYMIREPEKRHCGNCCMAQGNCHGTFTTITAMQNLLSGKSTLLIMFY